MPESYTLIVVPHTHWDREWYQTFQQFRKRLVQCVDHVLRVLEADPGFTYFMLDGQTVVLSDYLEVKPENEERLRTFARAGRLLVGPWYIQPDEFLVGGEAIVRNLLLGRNMAAPYGGAMAVGYAPDCFGHIAQMPQIWRGFGIDNAVFMRGLGPEVERSEFWWMAPDGSRVRASYLHGENGYSNAVDLPLATDDLIARLERVASPMIAKGTVPFVLLMNGTDHREPQDGLPAALAAANDRLAERGWHLELGTLPQYIAAVRDADPEIATIAGEFRSARYHHLLPAVLSTRLWIKQRDAAAEELLARWADPMAAWAARLGMEHPTGLLQLAWRFLLQNQPHDSICGCSIDQVHREMAARYDQCEQVAQLVLDDALAMIAAHVQTSDRLPPDPTMMALVVVNPTGALASAVVEAAVQVAAPLDQIEVLGPNDRPVPHAVIEGESVELIHQVFEKAIVVQALTMLDAEGRIGGYHVLGITFQDPDPQGTVAVWVAVAQQGQADPEYTQYALARLNALHDQPEVQRFDVTVIEAPHAHLRLLAHDLPAHGGQTYVVRPRLAEALPVPTSDLVATALALENQYLRAEIDPLTGTLTVTEKATGMVYPGLLRFEDSGDVGDEYTYSPPRHNTIVRDPAGPPKIMLAEATPVRATLHVAGHLHLPDRCTEDRQARHLETVDCPFTHEIALDAEGRQVQVRTTITNHARDHRLRIAFPTPIQTTVADAEGTFMVNRRAIQPDVPPDGWRGWPEDPVATTPQKRFVAVSDGTLGLAILNRGLPEYEVLPGATGVTLALTLLRCIGWLSRDDFATRRGHAGPMLPTPEAQMPGTWTAEYAILPHSGHWDDRDGAVLRAAQAYAAPPRALATGSHAGDLPAQWSFAQIRPASLVLSTVKRAEDGDGVIVRWYNPLDHAVEAEVVTALEFARASLVQLNEDPVRPLAGEVDAPMRRWRIPTPAGAIISLRLANGTKLP